MSNFTHIAGSSLLFLMGLITCILINKAGCTAWVNGLYTLTMIKAIIRFFVVISLHCSLLFPDHYYSDRLLQDTAYLKTHRNLTERIVDKIILQLNRVYPQVLSNKEAEKVT